MKRLQRLFCLCLIFAFISVAAHTALVKSDADVDEWLAIPQNTVREGATADISANYSTTLHIDLALTSATAHTGTKIEIHVSSSDAGDEDWTTLTEITSIQGTANPEALAGAEAQGQTVLEVADTTGYEADEARWIFILDDTVADSELAYLVSHQGTPSVTVLNGITNAHTAADTLYNIARTHTVDLPINIQRVRVVYDNTFDSNGSQVHTRCRLSQTTEL